MGFPYGDGLYGKGLYSRRPDWWRDKACLNDNWAAQACVALAIEPVPAPVSVLEPIVCLPPAWAGVTPDGPPAWLPASQQAVIREKERIWRQIR